MDLEEFRKKYPMSEKVKKAKEKYQKKMAQKAIKKSDITKMPVKYAKEELHEAHKHMKKHGG